MDRAVALNERRPIEELAGFTLVEGVGGAGAVVLAVLGLIGVLPEALASISAIAIGISLLIGGGTVASQYSKFLVRTEPGYADIVRGGLGMEVLCGFAGAVLGILALVGLAPLTLLPACAIVFGCALLMASAATARTNTMKQTTGDVAVMRRQELAREAVYAASASEVLMGAASAVLGILALANFSPLTLTLVAMLVIGTSVTLSGLSVAAKLLSEPRASQA